MTASYKSRFRVVLLLGSYDPDTEKVLSKLKEDIPAHMMTEEENVLIFLLRDIEIYLVDYSDENGKDARIILISDKYRDKITIIALNEREIIDSTEFSSSGTHQDQIIEEYAKRYPNPRISKLPILEKLRQLAASASLTMLVRHKEETRGGEYIELAFLLGTGTLNPSRVYFLKKEGFDMSEMGWELLDFYGVNFRSYKDENYLCNEMVRLIRYSIRKDH